MFNKNSDEYDLLPLALFCKDYKKSDKGVFTAWNRKAEVLWGINREDILGKTDFEIFPEEEALSFQEIDLKSLTTRKETHIVEEPVSSPNIGKRIVQTWKVPIVDKSSRYILGISVDITAQKKLEQKLNEERSRNIQDSKLASLGEMASGIAHEINNPLSIIQGIANRIRRVNQTTSKNKKIASDLEEIDNAIDRISNIVSGMRDISRNSSGDPLVATPIAEIIEGTLYFVSARLDKDSINLSVDLGALSNRKVMCRKFQMVQVLLNLINNAYTSAQTSSTKWVKIKGVSSGKKACISVMDSGGGVVPELRKKIFEPFFTTAEIGRGTGLGLSVSKTIVDQHGGTIEYDAASKHSCFKVCLPLIAEEKASLPNKNSPEMELI